MEHRSPSLWLRRQFKSWLSPRRGLSLWIMEDIGVGYIANPKAGSSSIRNLIREREGERLYAGHQFDEYTLKEKVEKRIKITTKAARAATFKDKLFLFSFVRNPLTRLYSCYRDKVINAAERQKSNTLSIYGVRFGMSFDDFIKCIAEIPDHQSDQHFRSQHTFLTHEDELIVHYLGKLERFNDDWQRLADEFGLACPGRDHRVSGPPVSAKRLPMTRRSAEIAAYRYRKDIEMLGYQNDVKELLDSLAPPQVVVDG